MSLAAFIRRGDPGYRALGLLAEARAIDAASRIYDEADEAAKAGNTARTRYLRAIGDQTALGQR